MKQCRMRVRIGRRRAERAQAARVRPHAHKLYSREEQHSNHLCCVTHRSSRHASAVCACVRACVRTAALDLALGSSDDVVDSELRSPNRNVYSRVPRT